jgi:hypothetical protein
VTAHEIPAQEPWKLVAQSDLIIVGTPTVPVDEIQRSGKYIHIPVRVKDCLKGDPCPETTAVRYFTDPAWYNPAPSTLVESSGNQSVLFLTYVDTRTITGAPEIYFAGHTPKAFQPYSRELIGQVSAEVMAQKQIIDQFSRNFRPEDEPSYSKVQSLVEAMVDRRTEKRAFIELEALGQVADAIDAILNQITEEDFGTIHNGASERERKAATDGWRIYLHRRRFGTHKPAG